MIAEDKIPHLEQNALGKNHLFSRLVVEELVRCGVRDFCIAPGSRSTPLVIAIAEHPETNSHLHFDERGAAFFALGTAKATGKAAAVVCTSGTAAANFYPAIIEANQARVPLLVLTCDRGFEEQSCGANQTIDQVGLYANFLRWSFSFPCPEDEIRAGAVLTAMNHAVYRANCTPQGPVQLNFQFRKPLVSNSDDDCSLRTNSTIEKWTQQRKPLTAYNETILLPSAAEMQRIAKTISEATRGAIFVGTMPASAECDNIFELAALLQWPIIADITSGLRHLPHRQSAEVMRVVAHAELIFSNKEFCKAACPDVLLHFGDEAINFHTLDYLKQENCERILVNAHPFRQDPYALVTTRVVAEPNVFCGELLKYASSTSSEISSLLIGANLAAENLLERESVNSEAISEWQVARAIFADIPQGQGIFLGNSLSVRHADAFVPAGEKKLHLACNRGVSGIDGTVAAAAGFATGLGTAATLLCGDLTLLHDLNSLALAKNRPLTIVVLNNDGGAIFSKLPIHNNPHFLSHFLTPHGLTFENAAQMFGLVYAQPKTLDDFVRVYSAATNSPQATLIEVRTSCEQTQLTQQAILSKVNKAISQQLIK